MSKDIFKPDQNEIEYLRRVLSPKDRARMDDVEPCSALSNFKANNPGLTLDVIVITDPNKMPGSDCRSQECAMRRIVDKKGVSYVGGYLGTCTICNRRINISQA